MKAFVSVQAQSVLLWNNFGALKDNSLFGFWQSSEHQKALSGNFKGQMNQNREKRKLKYLYSLSCQHKVIYFFGEITQVICSGDLKSIVQMIGATAKIWSQKANSP